MSSRPAGSRAAVALAAALAAVAGFVDAVGYLSLRDEFVAHMTGNTSRLGQHLGLGQLGAAAPLAVAVLAFVVSVAVATVLLARGRAAVARVLVLEAGLLAVAMVYGETLDSHGAIPRAGAGFYVVSAAEVAAMGVQSAVVVSWRSTTLRTTFLTGMLTRLGQSLGAVAAGGRGGDGGYRAGEMPVVVLLWGLFVGSGAAGALLLGRWHLLALALPLAAVLVLAASPLARAAGAGSGGDPGV
jgi:uncharacterized membrane protein YoaK (UPF0700 family)